MQRKISKKINISCKDKKILQKFFLTLDYLKKHNSKITITVDISEGESFLNYQNLGFKIYNKDDSNVIAINGDYVLTIKN